MLSGAPAPMNKGILVDEDFKFEEASDLVCSSGANLCRSARILGQQL